MKPLTPRNGADRYLILGTWTTLNRIPAFLIVEMFHGPVTQ